MNLRAQWTEFKEHNPRVRIRDAARQLGVTELQLVATGCGDNATRLSGPWTTVIERLQDCGDVMALTRNEHAVHERTGPYKGVRFMGHVGLVLGKEIDLRLFMGQWHHGFAVTVQTRLGPRHSLQFFDAHGQAVHKVYQTKESNTEAWDALVTEFKSPDQSPEQAQPEPRPAPKGDNPDVDAEAFISDWAALTDTHQFFGMVHRHKVSRRQALLLAEGRFTRRVSNETATELLNRASADEVPIMVFVGNPGCIQIHTGPVRRILPTGGWINVMDPRFNLHLRQSEVAESWVVEKPTDDGTVTSLELLGEDGEIIVRFFGERKPGIPEREDWRALAASFTA